MHKLATCLLAFCLPLLSGCGEDRAGRVLRVGHTLDTKHAVHQSLEHMAARIDHYSGGKLRLKIHANGQLGSEREMVELLQIGSLAITKVSAAALEGFVADMKVYSLPYIFRDRDHRWQVLQSDIGEEILASLQPADLQGLGYFDAGSRSFYSCDGMVRSPDDVAGKKIRVMNSATAIQMISAFGGAATPVSWGELYAALQQGVVDAAENNPPSYYRSRHYEICPYYSLDEHTSIPDVIVMSKHVMDSLNTQQRQWLKQAMNDAVVLQKSLWLDAENAALDAVRTAGVEVIYPDKEPFVDMVKGLHASFDNTLVGNYLERIQAVGGESQADE